MIKNEVQIKGKFHYKMIGWKYSFWVRLFLFIMLAILFYATLFSKLVPQVYDIQLGAVSEKSIYAPEQIENSIATIKAQEDAAKKVQPVYPIINMKNEAVVDAIFDKLTQINSDTEVSNEDKVNIFRLVIPEIIKDVESQSLRSLRTSGQYNAQLLEEIQNKLTEQEYRIPEEIFFKLPRLTKEDLDQMLPVTKVVVAKLMSD
jgi:membrane-associated HD superfamily phosphohydrolase